MNDPDEPETKNKKASAHIKPFCLSFFSCGTIRSEENFWVSSWSGIYMNFGCNNKFIGHLRFQWELILWIFMNRNMLFLGPSFLCMRYDIIRMMCLIYRMLLVAGVSKLAFAIQCSQYQAHIFCVYHTKWVSVAAISWKTQSNMKN